MLHRLLFNLTLAFVLVLAVACGGAPESGPVTETPEADAPETEAPPTTADAGSSEAATLGSSSVTGTVTYTGAVPTLRPLKMDADPACAAKHDGPVQPRILALGEGNTLGNVFVQVKNPPAGTYPTPSEVVEINQEGCLYFPRVAGVQAGQTLQFRNSDGILHNVHGLPEENREFNMGMPPTLTEADVTLTRPEPVFPVKCDVHPWMLSYVAVLEHPYFAVSDESGTFEISGLPAGTYEIDAWHEKLGSRSGSVTVGDGEAGTVDFSFAPPG